MRLSSFQLRRWSYQWLQGCTPCPARRFLSMARVDYPFSFVDAGHTYIAVAGLDMHSRMDQCSRTIQAAIDFLAVARDIAVDVRVGVHTGPALGGVLGAVRPRYVLFGETVKAVAEVMKSTPRNCCQASHATYVALGDEGYSSNFHDNGKTAEFGKEKLKLWLLECGEYKSALAEFLPSPVRKVSFKRGKRWRRMWTQGTPPGYKG